MRAFDRRIDWRGPEGVGRSSSERGNAEVGSKLMVRKESSLLQVPALRNDEVEY